MQRSGLRALYVSPHSGSLLSTDSWPICYCLLSCLKTNRASSWRTNNPTIPHNVCIIKIPLARESSLIGPNQTSHKFRTVKFVDCTISPFPFLSTLTRGTGKAAITSSKPAASVEGGCCHSVIDASSRFVLALKRGNRWRGQGMI